MLTTAKIFYLNNKFTFLYIRYGLSLSIKCYCLLQNLFTFVLGFFFYPKETFSFANKMTNETSVSSKWKILKQYTLKKTQRPNMLRFLGIQQMEYGIYTFIYSETKLLSSTLFAWNEQWLFIAAMWVGSYIVPLRSYSSPKQEEDWCESRRSVFSKVKFADERLFSVCRGICELIRLQFVQKQSWENNLSSHQLTWNWLNLTFWAFN